MKVKPANDAWLSDRNQSGKWPSSSIKDWSVFTLKFATSKNEWFPSENETKEFTINLHQTKAKQNLHAQSIFLFFCYLAKRGPSTQSFFFRSLSQLIPFPVVAVRSSSFVAPLFFLSFFCSGWLMAQWTKRRKNTMRLWIHGHELKGVLKVPIERVVCPDKR